MAPRIPRLGRHRAVQAGAVAAVLCALLTWWLAAPEGTPSPSGRMSIATGTPSGVYAKYGAMLKDDLARDLPALDVRVRHSQGSLDNLRQVASGEADFAIATADAVATYLDGGRPGAGRLRACARLYDDYIHLVVREDARVRSVRDLKGLKVGVGADGSGVQLIARRLLRAGEVDFERDITPVRAGINTLPQLLRDGGVDAFFWSGGLPTVSLRALSERLPVRLVPLDDMIAPLRRLGGDEARHYRAAMMPVDAYPKANATEAVKTIAVANLLITTDRAAAELTEGVTRTVIRSRDRIGQEVHAAQLVDLRTAVFTDPLPLHAGARRYYVSGKP
ncbi:TAXI family TRAP transporter solute-binding subunit [Streptomyces sp. AV19]|uniref:TAXI family TRAP transporter solute-binding subunit n=1 Tax=Streptomyces sp. AV19 TaxID=2793068 RepID=UPI0018FE3D74|nr:TAXI family TRAP transporter solute-binding subunit [Streptomyces sp. AV19]MBH1938684.1 TAXI family TRAP transporter solute-binding subunit [Streptomyces sp. AV19]MDG4535396.1 TAXI family TRAP transporter solute-binding subunit [Streptomyces sp. AV19]